jgi:hypothetical protein
MGRKKRKKTSGVVRTESNKQHDVHRRRFSWGSGIGIILLLVGGIALIAFFVIPRVQNKPLESLPLSEQKKPAEPLPQSGYMTGEPINKTDPMSGKPIVSGITSNYKGYTIGHCCDVSRQEWVNSDSWTKDAFIRMILR